MINVQQIQERSIALRDNRTFEMLVVGVIILSALLIGAKTYSIPSAVMQVILWLDVGITFLFLFEIIVRFIAEPNKKRFFHNGWNVFDTIVVVVSLIPIDNSDMALVGRLVRVFRVLRMVSIIPELRTLLNSLVRALPQLGYVVLLMFIIFYIYAAVGATFFAEINPVLWGDISISLLTLFRVMTFEDWTDVMYETMAVYPLSWSYYLTFIFFTAFAFLNMVIGIVVNVLEDEHAKERAEQAEENGSATLNELRDEIQELKALIINLKK
ncbi:ion transporter [Thalassolituus sp.]|jgi:voltage-gated sodium channel|uniref:ion transporter n=1 Tax=Thalassolituus sp. TaxID=2030822 RepID=UPI002A821237|nr:ion transporter [Thalassolituus sp.]|tara:strand:- start:2307 stop:3113 length:807 start_codon:yes stop_codon:yes gene_type:complete